jgi:hypothetical protein
MNKNIWEKLQSIDPKALYVIALIAIALPLVFPKITLPIVPGEQSIKSYETLQAVGSQRPQKLVLVDTNWSASSRGENQWQTQAIIEHLMKMHAPFAVMSFESQGPQLDQNVIDKLAPQYGYVYGKDYVNCGYQLAMPQTLKGIVKDFKGTLRTDWQGKPLDKYPVLSSVKSMKDIGAIVEITPIGSLDYWLGLVTQVYHTPIVFAPTAVMAPEGYPYSDSNQLQGILIGVKGAGDYEQLIGVKREGTQVSTVLSMVYGLIIVLIVIGNIGYHGARIAAKRAAEAEANA